MDARINEGYVITDSIQIGGTEFVLGKLDNKIPMYVTWACKGGDNYYWGCYCNTLEAAREKLNERYQSECQMPYNQQHDKKAKQHDGRER